MGQFLGREIKTIYADDAAACKPETTGAVLKAAKNAVCPEILGFQKIIRKGIGLRIEPINSTAFCSNPDCPIFRLIQVAHPVLAETVWFGWVMLVSSEAIPIEAAQSRLGSDPHKTLSILQNAFDGILHQSII